jgi:hypothetical protein
MMRDMTSTASTTKLETQTIQMKPPIESQSPDILPILSAEKENLYLFLLREPVIERSRSRGPIQGFHISCRAIYCNKPNKEVNSNEEQRKEIYYVVQAHHRKRQSNSLKPIFRAQT